MQIVYSEIITKLKTTIPALRYLNWDIGQLDGYYLKPPVSYPCALISFPQIATEPIGNNALMADVVMNIKLCTEKLSQTSNLVPATVMAKGNEIWVLQKAITKALHGTDGISYNTIQQIAIQHEQREDGLQVLNIQLGFIVEDFSAVPTTHIITPMGAMVVDGTTELPPLLPPSGRCFVADFATFNSYNYLESLYFQDTQYRYTCTSFTIDSLAVSTSFAMQFTRPNQKDIDIQVAPFITIPSYDQIGFYRDDNWKVFVVALMAAIRLPMIVNGSPLDDKKDTNYPSEQINVNHVYGEGFQLAWSKPTTWSFTIDYAYINYLGVVQTLHTIEFSNDGMTIDGATVACANKTEITI
jgi:hypothetical protein